MLLKRVISSFSWRCFYSKKSSIPSCHSICGIQSVLVYEQLWSAGTKRQLYQLTYRSYKCNQYQVIMLIQLHHAKMSYFSCDSYILKCHRSYPVRIYSKQLLQYYTVSFIRHGRITLPANGSILSTQLRAIALQPPYCIIR